MAKDSKILQFSFIVVGGDFHFAFQDDEGFVFRWVAVDGYLRAGFHGIEHTMAFIFKALMEVIIHPQTWRSLGLG